MSDVVIRVENLSKKYRLGAISGHTFHEDLSRWWAGWRGKPNPSLKIGQADNGNRGGEQIWALHDVNFAVRQGEVVGIIGRNGAGKSTLLKILSRVTAPTAGKVKVKGRIASLLEVGTGFHPELTGRENIYLNGAILGMKKAETDRKFDEIVDFSGVEKFVDTPVKRYSSGMYVRLAFAVAAHLDPEILLIDEVLAVGDAEFQKKCLGKMGDVASQGRTIFFVSHNMAAIEHLCQTAIMLDGGKIKYAGLQAEVISYYLRSFHKQVDFLENTQRRKGSGLVRFSRIEICSKDGQILSAVQSGQDIGIHLYYETDAHFSGGDINVGITVVSQKDIPIFQQSSRLMKTSFKELPKSGAFVCTIPNLPLPPSIYLITLVIKVNNELSDLVHNAAEIQVVEGDFFGSGRLLNVHAGLCLVRGEWSLRSNGYDN